MGLAAYLANARQMESELEQVRDHIRRSICGRQQCHTVSSIRLRRGVDDPRTAGLVARRAQTQYRSALQALTEHIMTHLAEFLSHSCLCTQFVLSRARSRPQLSGELGTPRPQQGLFEEIYLTPASARTTPTAIGAALAVEWAGASPQVVARRGAARSASLAQSSDNASVLRAIHEAKLSYSRPNIWNDNPAD